jgi:hypothetical protein
MSSSGVVLRFMNDWIVCQLKIDCVNSQKKCIRINQRMKRKMQRFNLDVFIVHKL